MKHDLKMQERETFETFAALKQQGAALPALSVVEFYLLAEDTGCDWDGCARALAKIGFAVEQDRENDTLIVTTKAALQVAPEAIWPHEKQVAEVGLRFDFIPDGWEFGFD